MMMMTMAMMMMMTMMMTIMTAMMMVKIMVTQHIPTSHNPARWESIMMMKCKNMTQSDYHQTFYIHFHIKFIAP